MMVALLRFILMGAGGGLVIGFALITGSPQTNQSGLEPERRQALVVQGVSTAAGTLFGILGFGLDRRRRRTQPWSEWRRFNVLRKTRESEDVTSFELKPQDGIQLPPYLPGQFLTLELLVPGQIGPLSRTYSISDYPASDAGLSHYRISVKRERAPQDLDVPPGLGSTYLHDQVKEGTAIRLLAPAGEFVLEPTITSPLVFVSNGVGITPVFAMLKAALQAEPTRSTWFIHGCRNSDYLAFGHELEIMNNQFPGLNMHLVFSRPKASDSGRYQHRGYINGELVQSLTQTGSEYFLCGSKALMEGLLDSLKQAGITKSKLHYERFVYSNGAAPEITAPSLNNASVCFQPYNITTSWSSGRSDDSILSLAESVGLKLKFGCRAGLCGRCTTTITQGSVSYISQPSATVQPGSALICVARPASEMLEVRQ